MKQISISSLLILAFILTGSMSCKKNAPKKKTGGGDALPTTPIDNTPSVTISVAGATGSTLYVSLNKAALWNFTATSSDGASVQVSRLTVATKPTSMQVNTNSISFTPTSQADLTGNLIAYATNATGTETSQTFYWADDPSAIATTNCPLSLALKAIPIVLPLLFDKNAPKPTLASLTTLLGPELQACAATMLAKYFGGQTP